RALSLWRESGDVGLVMKTFGVSRATLYRWRDLYTHGSNTLEVIWTIVPAVILVILAFMGQDLWENIKMRPPPGDVQVQVTSKQFNWDMRLSRTG
ncbi:MAG: cytochrome c oxidase subunit II transmembrane domain-containing protein, partial [Nitrospinota bacterium]|nr:cytochrome c oxidase subunit II transmembrane domain-containing protein [Nitrospinota bacterium]